MTLSVSHVILLALVAVVTTAAPVVEEKAQNQEQAVSLNGDSSVGDRAKRAKEEIVFGNQQNGVRAAGLAKKSFDLPPMYMAPGKLEDVDPIALNDKSGFLYAEREQPVPFEMLPPVVEEAKPVVEETKTVVEEAKPVEEEEEVKEVVEEGKPAVEEVKAVVEEAKPVVEEVETKVVEPAAVAEEVAENVQAAQEPESAAAQPVTNVEELVVPQGEIAEQAAAAARLLPEDSKDEDAEEVLEGQRQQEEEEADDVEDLLKELREENKAEVKGDVMEGEEEEAELKEKHEENEVLKNGEGEEDEADLQQVSGDVDRVGLDNGEYSRNLLQLLLDEDRMYRMPYPYYPAYLQRRRRSLAKRRLPHIHSRHRSKQLARAKRTKRDLLDDDLYYNDEDEEFNELPPEVGNASLEDLMAYLLALYPSLYDLQPPQQVDPYPGYKWFGSGYPEDNYPGPEVNAVPEWEEPEYEPEYVEVPAEYEPARWEPVFFPEPVEDDAAYYQPPAKRQMLSFVPGSRRKRYFFPFAREPYTHWGAFVPSQEKRSYEDAYRRLRELAVVLADARNPSYADAFEEYRKKK